jgi:hypothetical protein
VLPLFVNNKFIELQTGGYFVCTRPDLAPVVPSAQTPPHLRHHYHQVVEFSHTVSQMVVTHLGYLLESGTISAKWLQAYLSSINAVHNDFEYLPPV